MQLRHLPFVFITVLLGSCLQETDIPLKESSWVVEGLILDEEIATVNLTIVTPKDGAELIFCPDNEVSKLIQLEKINDRTEVLQSTDPFRGAYQSDSIIGEFNRDYTLRVDIGDDLPTIIGQTKMPKYKLEIDSVRLIPSLNPQGSIIINSLKLFFKPLPETNIFVRVLVSSNFNGLTAADAIVTPEIFIRGEDLAKDDWSYTWRANRQLFEDSVTIKTFVMEEAVWEYLDFIRLAQTQTIDETFNISLAPTDKRKANLTGDILGYFAAMTTDTLDVLIQ